MNRKLLKTNFLLTTISFVLFQKWHYADIVDGTDEMLYGLPFPFVCRGFASSMTLQFFLQPLLTNFSIYFIIWLSIIYIINKFLFEIKLHRFTNRLLFAFVLLLWLPILLCVPDSEFYMQTPFEIKTHITGYCFTWQNVERLDYWLYHKK